jgi:hypothetical protein
MGDHHEGQEEEDTGGAKSGGGAIELFSGLLWRPCLIGERVCGRWVVLYMPFKMPVWMQARNVDPNAEAKGSVT